MQGSKKAYIYKKKEKEKRLILGVTLLNLKRYQQPYLLFGMEGVGKKKTSASPMGHR
ncbi:hypothetical protein C1H46_009773 [Malus baccata]|uniref:Uncharacterized protein n=1 Tax=Malus baccata TaxID=106549 RepID=A0A540N228_MALBA|nr:hypothetical protein C1H46_009773 [Malus baccata]